MLRATKQAIRHVRTMDVRQAYDYLAAKGQAIKVGDKEDSYNTGLRQFLDEKCYKPTYEPFKLGTMLTDQRQAKNKQPEQRATKSRARRNTMSRTALVIVDGDGARCAVHVPERRVRRNSSRARRSR